MPENDIYGDGNIPQYKDDLGTTAKKILGAINLGAGGGSGSATWGQITGSITNQTDLQNALDGKLSESEVLPSSLAPSDIYWVGAGDSIMQGAGPIPTSSWLNLAADLSFLVGRTTVVNTAVSGRTLANIISAYAAEVYPYRPSAIGSNISYLVVDIGANDLATMVPATWVASLNSYITTAKADGFTIVLCTIMDRTGTELALNELNRRKANDGIRYNLTYDYLIDFDKLFPWTGSLTFFQDGTHPTENGQIFMARKSNSAMTSGGDQANPIYPVTIEPQGTFGGTDRYRGNWNIFAGSPDGVNNYPFYTNVKQGDCGFPTEFDGYASRWDSDRGMITMDTGPANSSLSLSIMPNNYNNGRSLGFSLFNVINSATNSRAFVTGQTFSNALTFDWIYNGTANLGEAHIRGGLSNTNPIFIDGSSISLGIANNATTFNYGDLAISTIGKTVSVKSGTNALSGTVTLVAGAGTIASTAIDANTVIVLSLKTVGGTILAQPYVATITPGTGVTLAGGGASNTSTYNWIGLKVN